MQAYIAVRSRRIRNDATARTRPERVQQRRLSLSRPAIGPRASDVGTGTNRVLATELRCGGVTAAESLTRNAHRSCLPTCGLLAFVEPRGGDDSYCAHRPMLRPRWPRSDASEIRTERRLLLARRGIMSHFCTLRPRSDVRPHYGVGHSIAVAIASRLADVGNRRARMVSTESCGRPRCRTRLHALLVDDQPDPRARLQDPAMSWSSDFSNAWTVDFGSPGAPRVRLGLVAARRSTLVGSNDHGQEDERGGERHRSASSRRPTPTPATPTADARPPTTRPPTAGRRRPTPARRYAQTPTGRRRSPTPDSARAERPSRQPDAAPWPELAGRRAAARGSRPNLAAWDPPALADPACTVSRDVLAPRNAPPPLKSIGRSADGVSPSVVRPRRGVCRPCIAGLPQSIGAPSASTAGSFETPSAAAPAARSHRSRAGTRAAG